MPTKKAKTRFDFCTENIDTNFYFLPVRDSFNKSDSFLKSQAHYYYNAFDEKNLSLKPENNDVYRLYFDQCFGYTYLITLQNTNLTIKKGAVYDLVTYDTNKLNKIEKLHYALLRYNHVINKEREYTVYNYYIDLETKKHCFFKTDSLLKLYPQLLDSNYIYKLKNKALVYNIDTFKYSVISKTLSQKQKNDFLNKLQLANFWQLPVNESNEFAMDGNGYLFEANANNKYQFIS